MILQENNKIIINFTNEEILIMIMCVMIFLIIIIAMFIYVYISGKLHDQYHEGYNKAKSDKVQYYKTIKKLIDSYDVILLKLTNDDNNTNVIKVSVLESMLEFRDSLKNYYNN